MEEKTYLTRSGRIHYWVSEVKEGPTLVFLPGLTADHRLFDKQIAYFEDKFTCLVWDAPGHGESRPFGYNHTLMDEAVWLHNILESESLWDAVIVGQSMGGYVAQCYMQRYPNWLLGFVSIDSAPIQRQYMSGWELWLMKHIEPVYKLYSWEKLLDRGSRGCAETEYGQKLMREMMSAYDKSEYCRLAASGYKKLADAVNEALPYAIDCPALLLVGEKDKAGSAKKYNSRWAKETGLPLKVIPNAGHNANTDAPEAVNAIIEEYIASLPKTKNREFYY